jgi:Fe2+ or Zn2+ uptake regulation protein
VGWCLYQGLIVYAIAGSNIPRVAPGTVYRTLNEVREELAIRRLVELGLKGKK